MSRLRSIPPKGSIPKGQKREQSLGCSCVYSPVPLKIEGKSSNQVERAIAFRMLKEITNEMKEIGNAIKQGIPHNKRHLGMLKTRAQMLTEELNMERRVE